MEHGRSLRTEAAARDLPFEFISFSVCSRGNRREIRTIKQVDIIVTATSSFKFIQEGKKKRKTFML